MALTIKDLLQSPHLEKLTLKAGEKGLGRYVTNAGTLDYEYAEGYHMEPIFEKEQFLVSSLLFAKDNPSLILNAIKDLNTRQVSCLAYKPVFIKNLPENVIAYCNDVGFPLLELEPESWIENIIFEIMKTVQADDTIYLTEKNISLMISSLLPMSNVSSIAKNISLRFKKFIRASYIRDTRIDIHRLYEGYTLMKETKDRFLMCRYQSGIFFITTNNSNNPETHRLIMNQVLDILGINTNNVTVSSSNMHTPDEFDLIFKESYYTYIASLADNMEYRDYNEIGVYKFLVSLAHETDVKSFSNNFLLPLKNHREYFETATIYSKNNGDIIATSVDMNCHQNTIRYRLAKIKSLVCNENISDYEFYKQLSIAIAINNLTE